MRSPSLPTLAGLRSVVFSQTRAARRFLPASGVSSLASLAALCASGLVAPSGLHAQQPGPGIPNEEYNVDVTDMAAINQDHTPILLSSGYSETWQDDKGNSYTHADGVFAANIGRTTVIDIHRGYLVMAAEAPGSISFKGDYSTLDHRLYDISDPGNPDLLETTGGQAGYNTHGSLKSGNSWRSAAGWTIDDDNNFGGDSDFPSGQRANSSWTGWQRKFEWSYGVTTDPYWIERYDPDTDEWTRWGDDPNDPWNVIGETGVTGMGFIMGNLLIKASDQSMTGVAAYDISDPANPVLLDFIQTEAGIGSYWPVIWKHWVIAERNDLLHAVDFSDPTDLKVTAIPMTDAGLGGPGEGTSHRQHYMSLQDDFLFVDRFKVDLSPLESGGDPVIVQALPRQSPPIGFPPTSKPGTSQWALPAGNLWISGGYSGAQGAAIWMHDPDPSTPEVEADDFEPSIAYHMPRDGGQYVSTVTPIVMLIHETIETNNLRYGETVFLREVDGSDPVDGSSFVPAMDLVYSMDDFLTINPNDPLQPGVTYEVILTTDALTDAVGNSLKDETGPGDKITVAGTDKEIAYRFSFTTDDGSESLPEITAVNFSPPAPIELDGDGEATVQITATATDADNLPEMPGDGLEYLVVFGDGTDAAPSESNDGVWTDVPENGEISVSHIYTKPGNYRALIRVREKDAIEVGAFRVASETLNFLVHEPIPTDGNGDPLQATQSSTIAVDNANDIVWSVNPDNDSVARIDASDPANYELIEELGIGEHPTGVAVDAQGRAWVTCRDDDSVWVLNSAGTGLATFDVASGHLAYGDRPTQIVFAPDGQTGFITLEGRSTVLEVDGGSGSPQVVGRLPERNGLNVEFYDFADGGDIASVDDLTAQSLWEKKTDRNFKVSSGVWHGKLDSGIRKEFYHTGIRKEETHNLFFRGDDRDGPHRDFGAIYRGYLEIADGEVDPAGSEVTFTVSAGGPFRLEINGALVVENTTELGSSDPNNTGSGSIELTPGRHYFEYRFYTEVKKKPPMSVEYAASGISQQEIPASRFYPANETRRLGALAVNAVGTDLLVAQQVSDDHAGRIARYDIASGDWAEQPLFLFRDWFTNNTEVSSTGVPNYIFGLAFGFNSDRAWYAGHKANTHTGLVRGSESGGESTNSFQTTIRAQAGIVDLSEPDYIKAEPWNGDEPLLRVDIDNHSQPRNIAFSPLGTQVVLAMQSMNKIMVLDAFTGRELDAVEVGLAPQGLAIRTRSDDTREIWVQNFTDRSVTVLDGSAILDTAQRTLGNSEIATFSSIDSEWKFTAEEVKGQQFFYSAGTVDPDFAPVEISDPTRMAQDGYLACAVCHDDGGHDGRTWDFSHRGEGLRNTIDLRGRSGISQGNAHWSGNFDEIHDFENDIRDHFGGAGFLSDEDFEETSDPLGNFKTGRNEDLDALVAYVTSLGEEDLPRSPYRADDGALTNEADQGRQVFASMDCADCHNPANGYTNSERGSGTSSLFDVGTLKASSGERLGAGDGSLTGIDTPSLLGLHASAPYLHDGTASTVDAVFEQATSGGAHDISGLSHADRRALMAYLLQIDGREDGGELPVDEPGSFRVTTESVDVNEDGGSVQVVVQRVNGSAGSVSVSWSTVELSGDTAATPGEDYTASSGTLTWDDGESFDQVISVPILNDQNALEPSVESFGVVLGSPTDGATLAEPSLTLVNILENDSLPTVSIASSSVANPQDDDPADGVADSLNGGSTNELVVGKKGSDTYVALLAYQLPTEFDSADAFAVNFKAALTTGSFIPGGMPNLDVHLLRISASSDLFLSDFEATPLALVGDNLMTADNVLVDDYYSLSNQEQQDFLALLQDEGAAVGDYVILMLKVDGAVPKAWAGYRVAGDTHDFPPVLEVAELKETDTLRIDTDSLPDATAGSAYSTTLAAVNGGTPYAWSLDAGPSWLSLDSASGELSGTPASGDVGGSAVTVTVTDDASATHTKTFTLTVEESGGGAPVTTRYEAEDFTAQEGTTTKSGNGSTGSFQDYGASGTWIEWNNIDGGSGGDADLEINYAMGADGSRYCDIYVNGETTPSISGLEFPSTGNWQTWSTVSATVSLNAGANTIKIEASPGSQGPNIDYMDVIVGGGGGGTTVIAEDDSDSVDEGGSKSVAVLDNDTNATQIDSFTQGSVGSVSQSGDELVYTPDLGVWSGTDSFDYTAGDGSTSDSATVTMTIDATNGTTDPIGGGDFDQLLAFRSADGDIRERSDGSYELAAFGGDGISTDGSGDQFLFAQKEVSGDFTAHARVKSIDGPSGSFAGVMLRDGGDEAGNATLEKMAFEASEKGDFYLSQERTTAGSGAAVAVRSQIGGVDVSHSEPEKWVMIERAGDEITYFTGEDDGSGTIVYTPIDAGPVTLGGLSDTVQVGLFTISGNSSDNATAVFDNYTVTATGGGDVTDYSVRWTFDDTLDESATGDADYDGAWQGGGSAAYVAGQTGNAVSLDGSHWIALSNPDTTILEDAFTERSYSLWFNPSTVSGTQILFEEGGGLRGINFYLVDDTLYAGAWNDADGINWSGDWITQSGITADTWHHVVLTIASDGSDNIIADSMVLYHNGSEVGKAQASKINGHGSDPAFGHDDQTLYAPGTGSAGDFNGALDDFRIYERELSATEVDSIHTAAGGGGGTPASLLVHYDFDDDGGSTATDASGNGRDGSITGATWSGDTPDGSTSSLSFDGSGDLVEDADAADYLDGLDAYTVTVWVKSNSDSNNAGIYRLSTSTGDNKNQLRYDVAGWGGGGTKVLKAGFETTTASVQGESADNAMSTDWQHIALSWSSGSEPKLYLDGQPFDWDTDGSPFAPGTVDGVLSGVQTLLIGAGGTNETWDGWIDDFRIYDEELSASEISDIHSGN